MAFLSGGRGGESRVSAILPVFWLTLGWTVTHEPMLRGKPVILWHVVPLLLRGAGLETQKASINPILCGGRHIR